MLQFWEENDDELLEALSDDGIELWEGGEDVLMTALLNCCFFYPGKGVVRYLDLWRLGSR